MAANENPSAGSTAEGAKGVTLPVKNSTSDVGQTAHGDTTERDALLTGYLDAGFALVPIPHGKKGPIDKGWNLPENCIRTPAEVGRLDGNVGVAHAYCKPSPTCAIDIDAVDKARPWLKKRGVDVDALLTAPDAVRIDSGRPGRAKLLYQLPQVMPTQKPPDAGLELRCGTKDGLTVQDVLPPSIHPETGLPYRLIGDIATIPEIPAPLLALWQDLSKHTRRGKKLDDVKNGDSVLLALNELGMVRSDEDGGKFRIDCPFADRHTMDGGDGETVYYLPHTNGYAMSHFKCLHAHCADRSDAEFMMALLARYTQQCGKPAPFALADVPVTAKPAGKDDELQWLIDHAPPALRSYIGWYMASALRPHPIFALVSALVFIQALFGRNVIGPRENRLNFWLILFAPTESGKGDVFNLASNALKQIGKMKTANNVPLVPSVPHFERSFGSAEGIWWLLSETSQVIWADEEYAKTLARLIAAAEGTHAYNIKATMLTLYDAAEKEYVPPINYSKRNKSNAEMTRLCHPFFVPVGSGVLRDISKLSAAASEDGLLNRHCVIVVDDIPEIGSIEKPTALPSELMEWVRNGHAAKVLTRFFLVDNPIELPVYTGLEADWKAELNYGVKFAQDLPGVWGRYAQKILKVAMIYAMADSGEITKAGFEWARRFMRWSLADFARHFEAEGGGAENDDDALGKAFMAAFKAPALANMDVVSSGRFAQFGGRCWRSCKNANRRKQVIESLIQDGLIEAVPLQPTGVGYRKLS